MEVRKATLGLSPSLETPGVTGQPVTPWANQSPEMITMPSLDEPES